jgi:hypothetical protein
LEFILSKNKFAQEKKKSAMREHKPKISAFEWYKEEEYMSLKRLNSEIYLELIEGCQD